MEYIFIFLLGWVVLCLPALIYSGVIEGRRRRDVKQLDDQIRSLVNQIDLLERRTRTTEATATHNEPATAPATSIPPRLRPTPQPVEVEGVPLIPPRPRPASPTPTSPPRTQTPPIAAEARVQPPAPPSLRNDIIPVPEPRSAKKSAALEETVGTNWLPKLGITILVVGVGLFVGSQWSSFTPWLRVLLLYAAAFAGLAGGIFLERKEQFRVLGRALIGGGWAVLALVTYAIGNIPGVVVVQSATADLFLLLLVVGVMVWHTLKYESQLVTGTAFLLGFMAIGLNPEPPYNLIAGVIVVAGLTVIVLRRRWFELEVFGILAAYLNHSYWLYSIYERQGGWSPFPQLISSLVLVIVYWAIFRTSYLVRKVADERQESVSTISGLLNPVLFLAVMRYQAFHPELAFYALLIMGAVEFSLGQLGVSRQRKAPFYVLSSLGAALMVAAFPFRFSGSALEVLWLAGAEAFLLAGVFTRERLFRGFGLIISLLVAGYALVVRVGPPARHISEGRPHSDLQLSLLLAMIAIIVYANAHLTRRLWAEMFDHDEEHLAQSVLSYLGSILAAAAIFAAVPDKAAGIALALLGVLLNFAARKLAISEFNVQAHWISVVAFIQAAVAGSAADADWYSVPQRVLMFVPVAALFYLGSYLVRTSRTWKPDISAAGYSWAATVLLGWLAWYQLPPLEVSLAWGVFGLALFEIGYAQKPEHLRIQGYAALVASFVHLFYSNFNTRAFGGWAKVLGAPAVVTVLPLIAIFYWVYARAVNRGQSGAIQAPAKKTVEFLLACLGTAAVASLVRFEVTPEIVVVGYALLTVALLATAWRARQEIFLYQTLAMLAVTAFRISMHNFYYLHEQFTSSLTSAVWAIGILAAGVPLSFKLRGNEQEHPSSTNWGRVLAHHLEQPMFFVPVVLMVALLWLKLSGGMVTLAWGVEALVVFLFALWAKERSFRWAGLGLLVLCVGKLIFHDAWYFDDVRVRYLTWIGVGALLLLVSYLYGRNREALREYL